MSERSVVDINPPLGSKDPAGNRLHPLLRMRYQLLGGLLVAVGLPFLIRLAINWQAAIAITTQTTIVAAVAAHLMGYVIYKRLDVFPGVAAFSTILPAFVISYGLVFLSIFFLRLDYSRFQAGSSFLLSASWYFGLSVFIHRLEPYRLAIVPLGDVERLMRLDGVIWERLSSPAAQPGRVQGVVADLRTELPKAWERFITDCVLAGIPVYHVKQILESLTGRVAIEHLSENTLGSLNPNQVYFGIKQLLDWLSALVVLVIGAPFLLIVALAIRFESPGPALFRQPRVGYRGQIFTVYKFRTMRAGGDDARSEKDQAITQKDDHRITRIGRVLRRTRIDELPQVINVLRGEMSWIGPRPEAVVLSQWYQKELAFYTYRHIVRPGVTGWAQVNQGHVASVSEVHQKLYYDFYYIKNFSPWLDLVVALRTIRIMLTGFGAR
ncbi:sugar transferase [Aquamicrobium soli]|uniref:Sugar transferase n=1 Tax=Aquamicrobium soli TaxID=1811518 RepID=A0ABV7K8N7_9HYPH